MAASTANYSILQAIIRFKPEGSGTYVDIGNAPKISLALTVETLEHKSSRTPSRETDLVLTVGKSGKITMTLEEITAYNLALWALHDGYASGAITILKDASITGAFLITGTNDQGNAFEYDLPNVQIRPSSTLELISEGAIASIELSGDILTPFGTITAVTAT